MTMAISLAGVAGKFLATVSLFLLSKINFPPLKMMRIFWGILLFLNILYCPLKAIEVRLVKEIHLQEKTALLERPSSFIRTKDGLFVVSDFQAGDLKVYQPSGELIKTFGRKGQGPDEFLSPLKLSYYAPNLGVVDIDRRMVFLIKTDENGNLKTFRYFSCPGGADVISLSDDRVTVSGYYVNPQGVPYSVYQYIFKSKKISPIFFVYETFGFSSQKEYENRFSKEVAPLGMKILCDQHHDDVFAVWNSDLKIFKKNTRTGKVTIFGQKTSNYIRPQNTKALEKAKKERNLKKVQEEFDKFSNILAIAATDQSFVLIYRNSKKLKGNKIIQIYDYSGNFLGETEIPSPAERGMFHIPRDEGVIYELSYEDSSPLGAYKIRSYELDSRRP